MLLTKKSFALALTLAISTVTSINASAGEREKVTCTLKGVFTKTINTVITADRFNICDDSGLCQDRLITNDKPDDPDSLPHLPGLNKKSPDAFIFGDIKFNGDNTESDRFEIDFIPSRDILEMGTDVFLDAYLDLVNLSLFGKTTFSYSELLKGPVTKFDLDIPWYSRKSNALITRRANLTCSR